VSRGKCAAILDLAPPLAAASCSSGDHVFLSIGAAIRLYGAVALFLSSLAVAPAAAQNRAADERPPAERFLIEGSLGWWNPSPQMSITSDSFAVVGRTIDLQQDLGLTKTRFRELHLVFHPARKHKVRFQYIPLDYNQTATLQREIVFNGQRYSVGLPVISELDWEAYRFGYEYDFISTSRGFGGVLLDLKQTHVRGSLRTPLPQLDQFADRSAPVPAIGGIARVYVIPAVSITGELSLIKVPESTKYDFRGHYTELDIYGTLNFNRNIGAQLGYRSLDVDAVIEKGSGSFAVKGLYFGIVARY
jgi:hypothetical protein